MTCASSTDYRRFTTFVSRNWRPVPRPRLPAALERGEMIIVPRGVEHRPVAESEAQILLFEPAETVNTGNLRNERTVIQPRRI